MAGFTFEEIAGPLKCFYRSALMAVKDALRHILANAKVLDCPGLICVLVFKRSRDNYVIVITGKDES